MIGWLHGRLRDKHPPSLVLDVGGVGYELEAPMTTFTALPSLGAEVSLFVHQVVREDALLLFGFAEQRDRDLFRMLLKVNGVGARLALAILSGMDAGQLSRCIYEGDTDSLSRLPGIGKKTAERLVIEMRDRIDKAPGMASVRPVLPGTGGVPVTEDPAAEAVNALMALGLKGPDATRRVQAVATEGLACEEIVRKALQGMAR